MHWTHDVVEEWNDSDSPFEGTARYHFLPQSPKALQFLMQVIAQKNGFALAVSKVKYKGVWTFGFRNPRRDEEKALRLGYPYRTALNQATLNWELSNEILDLEVNLY